MLFAAVFILLFCVELLYFRMADKLNIIDKPNQRSSHTIITLRGGGIIFPLSLIAYFLFSGFQYPAFILGLVAISVISFADDIKNQHQAIRVLVQFSAVAALLFQAGVFHYPLYWALLGLIMVIGTLNAYNFMDGINGITTGYSFIVLASFYLLNQQLEIADRFDDKLLIFLALGNLVFAFFNFRKKAKCFAGDVGSVSMAFSLLFFLVWCVVRTFNPLFILFFAVYGVDTVLTIIHRLYKRENIFDAHRQHLYQYLANEQKVPQLTVTGIYMIFQAVISAGVLCVWQKDATTQLAFAGLALSLLTILHVALKATILKKLAAVATK